MKLYLSSYRIPTTKKLVNLLGAPFEQIKLAVVENAKDYKDAESRSEKHDLLDVDLKQLGFKKITYVDLRDYYADQQKLRSILLSSDALFCAGGSTPALRIAMVHSGFDNILDEFLEACKTYIGESAGAYITGPSIEVYEDNDYLIGLPEFPYEGLAIIDDVVIPHCDDPEDEDIVRKMQKTHASKGRNVIKLNDDQVLIVNGPNASVETGVKFR